MHLPLLVLATNAFALTTALSTRATYKTQKLTTSAQELFDFSMSVGDSRWDDSYKYIMYPDNGPWSARFTSWYCAGLLQRNTNNDVANAEAAIENLIGIQMNDNYTSAWFGDYKLSPDEPNPTPNGPLYVPSVYNSYDPNWREFIGAQLVQIVAEFEHLLTPSLVKSIEKSLSYAAVGSMRRNGTFPEGDNLIIGYSNPQFLGLVLTSWLGERLNNKTFIDHSEERASKVLEIFNANGSKTLSEYNAPTYYGVDVFALGALIKYAPVTSKAAKIAPYILTELWKDIAEHYNPYLGNIAGPYDRAYGRDMTTHSVIIGQWWWALLGHDKAPLPHKGGDDMRYDVMQGAAISLLAATVRPYLSSDVVSKLTIPFTKEKTLRKTIRTSLDTDVLRIATSWLSKSVMIGGQQLAETVNRGKQFVPAVIHWASDTSRKPFPYTGLIVLYPTASTITAVASANKLSVSYPNSTQAGSNIFTFEIQGLPPKWTLAGNVVDGFSNLPCLKVNVTTSPGLVRQPTIYQLSPDFLYNVSYTVPSTFSGVPKIELDIKYTC